MLDEEYSLLRICDQSGLVVIGEGDTDLRGGRGNSGEFSADPD
jgi:hypothetical protein